MEISEVFRKTLALILNNSPRGAKSRLADSLSIDRTNLSGFFSGKDSFSEERRASIAKYLGFEYTEFINLGSRLWQSDEPWLWALRAIYLDEQRFRDLVNESEISETRFKGIFNLNKSLPLMPEEKGKILEATGFTEDEFLDFGRREILKNPKMKWDLGGMTQRIGTSVTVPYRHEASGLSESSDDQSLEDDQITLDHIELVRKFRYKELAKQINEDLVKINDPSVLEEVAILIKGIAIGMGFEFKLTGKSSRSAPSDRSGGNLKNGTEH